MTPYDLTRPMPTTTTTTPVTRKRPLTPWELPSLLTPLHTYRRPRRTAARERPHFAALLAFVYRNRFAVASQIQRRFPEFLRSDRTARRHLEELEALGHLAVAPSRAVGPLFPKVYYVTGRGLRKLQGGLAAKGKTWKARPDRRSRHSRQGYGPDHVLHELLVTEFLLAVWQTVQGRPDLGLPTLQRRSLAKHSAFRISANGRQTWLEPDAMFVFRQKDNGMVCCLVEMDNGTMNRKQIHEKYRRYEAWGHSDLGQRYLLDLYRRFGAVDPRPSFRVLIAANDRTAAGGRGRMADLLRASRTLPASMRQRLWFTTMADLQEHGHEALPLAGAIWRRGRDAGTEPEKDGADQPRHPLFPHPPPPAV
jgi:protein involved in plasmid replication-relaxation